MSVNNSEDDVSQKFDLCVADSLVKIGGGLAIGVIASLFLFKRKSWPVAFGAGVGAGMSFSNCQAKLNAPYLVMAERVKVKINTKETY